MRERRVEGDVVAQIFRSDPPGPTWQRGVLLLPARSKQLAIRKIWRWGDHILRSCPAVQLNEGNANGSSLKKFSSQPPDKY